MMPSKIESLVRRIKNFVSVFRSGRNPMVEVMDFPKLTEEDMREIKSFFPMPKFFIFGYARSGTTLLSRLLNLHPDVYTSRLGHFFTYKEGVFNLLNSPATQDWLQRPSMYWNGGKSLSTKMMRSSCDFILEKEAKKFNKNIVGDKSNNNTVNEKAIERLKLIYPDAKVIFLIRDGRDVAVSQRIRFFIELPKYLDRAGLAIRKEFLSNPDSFLQGKRSIFSEKGLKQEALNWSVNVTKTDAMARKYYPDHYYSLRFEDLILTPVKIIKDIWSFLGANVEDESLIDLIRNEMEKNPDAKWQKKQDLTMPDNLQKGKTRNWTEVFTTRDRELFVKFAGKTLKDWNYEKNPADNK